MLQEFLLRIAAKLERIYFTLHLPHPFHTSCINNISVLDLFIKIIISSKLKLNQSFKKKKKINNRIYNQTLFS